MARTAGAAGIPIALWVCAAVVAHLAGGGGAMKAAEIARDEAELRAAVRFVREGMHPADTTIELISDDATPTPSAMEPPKEDGPTDDKPGEVDPDAPKLDPEVKPPPPKPKDPEKEKEKPKPEPPKVEPPKPPEPPKPKPEPLKPLAPVAPAPAAPPPPPPPPPDVDHRIAVRQHVEKNQADNPSANRIADDANHVEKETYARARAQDQDSANPSLGSHVGGPKDGDPGDSKDDHSGSAEDHKGDDKHAPGEGKVAATDSEHERPKPPAPASEREAPPPSVPGLKGAGGKVAQLPEAPPPSPGGAGPASPETVSGDKGTYALDPVNPGGDGSSRRPGRKRPHTPYFTPSVHANDLGLGGKGIPGGPNLNLNDGTFQKAVGNEELARERAADGAARRAAHRGKWEKNNFNKWKPAIENYEPSVKLDNVTALNAARSPFATYLNTIHNRIHPIFAEEWLEFLNGLPKNSPLNDMTLVTNLEIVVDKDTGKIVRMGVTKASGYTAYDVAALNAVDRAGPFGKAPDIIASPDGNVYLHWEFHRDPFDACTTRNARPFILKSAPAKPVKPVGPVKKAPAPTNPDDRSAPSGPLVPMR